MIQRSACVLVALLPLAGCDHSCVTGALSTKGLTKEQQSIVTLAAPWGTHARTCQVAGYQVAGPADGSSGELLVTGNGATVYIAGPNQIHVQSKGGSLVSIQDLGGTGRFDWVSYDVLDPADGQKYNVTDADADGRLDTKIGDRAGFVNINGQWSKFDKRSGQLGAVVAGEWRPLEKHDRLWQLKTK